MTSNPNTELLSLAQAAVILGINRRTLTRRVAIGQITATKLGDHRTAAVVITRAEIDRVLAEVGVPARDGERAL